MCEKWCLTIPSGILSISMHIYKIWWNSVELFSRYWALTKFWRKSRAITLVPNVRKMTCNNPKLHLVHVNAYIKIIEILSSGSHDIERKFWLKWRAITLVHIWENYMEQSQARSCQSEPYIKFDEKMSIGSQDIERKRKFCVNQGS